MNTTSSAVEEGWSFFPGLPDILTLEQAATVLQIGITTAREMCRSGRLPACKIGQQWRVPKTWLCDFMKSGSNYKP